MVEPREGVIIVSPKNYLFHDPRVLCISTSFWALLAPKSWSKHFSAVFQPCLFISKLFQFCVIIPLRAKRVREVANLRLWKYFVSERCDKICLWLTKTYNGLKSKQKVVLASKNWFRPSNGVLSTRSLVKIHIKHGPFWQTFPWVFSKQLLLRKKTKKLI